MNKRTKKGTTNKRVKGGTLNQQHFRQQQKNTKKTKQIKVLPTKEQCEAFESPTLSTKEQSEAFDSVSL